MHLFLGQVYEIIKCKYMKKPLKACMVSILEISFFWRMRRNAGGDSSDSTVSIYRTLFWLLRWTGLAAAMQYRGPGLLNHKEGMHSCIWSLAGFLLGGCCGQWLAWLLSVEGCQGDVISGAIILSFTQCWKERAVGSQQSHSTEPFWLALYILPVTCTI